MSIDPDTKDWTWVLERPCPECGFDAQQVRDEEVGALLRASTLPWPAVLRADDSRVRPSASVWSPLEYACHVRDVHRVFGERLALMLERENPEFENWDQDETAERSGYGEQHPLAVADELVQAGCAVAAQYDAVPGEQWTRPGRRSNGSTFTVGSLARYHLHDVRHHLYDVGS